METAEGASSRGQWRLWTKKGRGLASTGVVVACAIHGDRG